MAATDPQYPGYSHPSSTASFPLGSHPEEIETVSELLPVREVAMLSVMERLTDKPEWHRKVFDDEIVSKWKAEALAVADETWMEIAATPSSKWIVKSPREPEPSVEGWDILDETAFDYCIQELRNKAAYFEKTGLIPTLDALATVVKSDVLVEESLRDSLKKAFDRLRQDQSQDPDWHPNSGDMVQDLVHPSMYPLVRHQSRVLNDEVIGISDAIEKWAGKGEVIQATEMTYQWLPSNVAFQDDGSVKLTSYINNLHPTKYPEIYAAVEQMIGTALPAWEQCLLSFQNWKHWGPGRKGSRFGLQDNAHDEVETNWTPSTAEEVADVPVDFSQWPNYREFMRPDADQDEVKDNKWRILRKPVFTGREPKKHTEIDYGHYTTANEQVEAVKGRLYKQFKNSGLQVIVKMASVELTPEKPEFPVGGWHIEGLPHESICATALYYLDSENITESSLAFRMATNWDQEEIQYTSGQDLYHWLECFYGTDFSVGSSGNCLQNYGSVVTREGRLLAFPNVFQHRVSSFKLADPTKPGHRRFIALWLVDPHQRIISTASVPPQRQDWWLDSAFGKSIDSQKSAADKLPAELLQLLGEKGIAIGEGNEEKKMTLPPELLDYVRQNFNLGFMSLQQAKEHRLALMQQRTVLQSEDEEERNQHSYNFCEH